MNQIAFHPDGTTLATSGDDLTVRLWDAESSAALHVLRGHTSPVSPLAFSPDGKLLASASAFPGSVRRLEKIDTTVRTWDPGSGAPVRELRGHAYAVNALAFSPDGRLLASASLDQTVKVWDAAGTPRHTLTAKRVIARMLGSNPFWAVAFNPDGTAIAAGSSDKVVRLWDVSTGRPYVSRDGLRGPARSVAFSPDGTRLAAHDDEGTMIWPVSDGQTSAFSYGIDGSDPSFSPDGTLLLTRRGNHAMLWEAAIGIPCDSLKGHTRRVEWAGFSPDGRHVVTASTDHTARVWNVDSGECVNVLTHPVAVWTAAWSPDGTRLATVGSDRTARLWAL